jgi:hypothetical protein
LLANVAYIEVMKVEVCMWKWILITLMIWSVLFTFAALTYAEEETEYKANSALACELDPNAHEHARTYSHAYADCDADSGAVSSADSGTVVAARFNLRCGSRWNTSGVVWLRAIQS